MKQIFSLCVLILVWTNTFAQETGMAINTTGTNPDSSAILDVSSTSKGFLMPRMTTTQRDSIHLPATGLLVYNITSSTFDYYTGSSWLSLTPASTTSTVPIIRTYTSDAIWTKPANLKYIVVEMVGGGGGGSGTGGSRGNIGSGGGAGGYSKKIISSSLLGLTENITVGIGGSGGASIGNPGLNGTNSSFSNYCSATGGSGGLPPSSNGQGGNGGLGIDGDINITGKGGSSGASIGNTGIGVGGGSGGNSYFGGGAPGSGLDSDGITSNNYGGGGSGGSYINTSRKNGGNGSGGIVIITEYY